MCTRGSAIQASPTLSGSLTTSHISQVGNRCGGSRAALIPAESTAPNNRCDKGCTLSWRAAALMLSCLCHRDLPLALGQLGTEVGPELDWELGRSAHPALGVWWYDGGSSQSICYLGWQLIDAGGPSAPKSGILHTRRLHLRASPSYCNRRRGSAPSKRGEGGWVK